MAFKTIVGGDRFGQRGGSNIPKTYAVGRFAAPAVGNLCKQDTTAGFASGVVQAGSSDLPLYLIESVNSSNSTLSVWKLPKVVQLVFEYAGTPALGQNIQANGTTGTIKIGGFVRDVVKGVTAGTGVGLIVAIDDYAVGTVTVEFGT